MLDKRNKKLAGVCAGLARYWDMDVTLIRVLWLAIAITTGVGFIAYLAAWIVIPSDYGDAPEARFVPTPMTPGS
jgi:phage shock protein PspC (stress-responsive transcriptional regulator)